MMVATVSTIGERIRDRREALEITLSDLARSVGLTRYALAKIESGETKDPKVDTLRKIAAEIDMPVQQLIGVEEIERGDWESKNVQRDVNHSMEYMGLEEGRAFAHFTRNYIHLPPEDREEFWGYVVYFFRSKGVQVTFKQPRIKPSTQDLLPYTDEPEELVEG
jgi:transcriptional regulator with XRE-family HTH domain